MDIFLVTSFMTLLCTFLALKIYFILPKKQNLPPGNLGFPIIGESISLLVSLQQAKLVEWIEERIRKHGSIFKTSLMGFKVVMITGEAGNKFIFNGGGGGDNGGISSSLPSPAKSIFGRKSIFELSGLRHKLVRVAMSSFLKPESIQRYATQMDFLIKQQLLKELNGKETVEIVSLVKKITFKITCSLLFGLPEGKEKDALFEDFIVALKGSLSIPLYFPGTKYRKALLARSRIARLFSHLIEERKKEVENSEVSSYDDIISCLVALKDETGNPLLEEEIIDNLVTLMIGSHDTITVLLSFMIQKLSRDLSICKKVLQEQTEIVKESGGKLGWREVQQMKYTWNVAQEVMRLNPPANGNFKLAARDIQFAGFDIPKGWQVMWVAHATHMDKNIFKDPYRFDPSRFEATSKTFPPYTYIPFGAGYRICPGAEFARSEVLMIIHHLITNYSWTELVENEPIVHDPMPYPAMGLPVKLYPREKLAT